MALTWFTASLALSALIGIAVWRSQRRLRRRWLRVLLTVCCGAVIFMGAGLAFVILGLFPATDEILTSQRRVSVYITTLGVNKNFANRADRVRAFSRQDGIGWTDGGPIPREQFFDQFGPVTRET